MNPVRIIDKVAPIEHDTVLLSVPESETWGPTERIRVLRFRSKDGHPDFRLQRLWKTIGGSGPAKMKWRNVEEVELAVLDELAAGTKMNSIIEFERP